MEIYSFTLVKNAAHIPLGYGSLDFGLALYDNVCDLYNHRNTQVDVDAHLWDMLDGNVHQAVGVWTGHTAFLAEPATPLASRKKLCLCCKEWRNA